MRSYENKTGLTLVEMLIVVAIIVILTTMVIGIAGRIDNQSKEQLAKGTIVILTAALRQFHDYEYRYRDNPIYTPAERQFYLGLDFPVDCNGFLVADLAIELGKVLDKPVTIIATGHDPINSGCEALYVFLSQVPECRKTLDKIDKSLITSEDSNKQPMNITIGGKVYPLLRVVDPWDKTLRYDYYNEWEIDPILRQRGKRTFPVITSAGPDRKFGTTDDISSRK